MVELFKAPKLISIIIGWLISHTTPNATLIRNACRLGVFCNITHVHIVHSLMHLSA
jgi:hypothetical protein